jgi:hypothetical protein
MISPLKKDLDSSLQRIYKGFSRACSVLYVDLRISHIYIYPKVSSLSEPFIRHLGEKAKCIELLSEVLFFVTKLNSLHSTLKKPKV